MAEEKQIALKESSQITLDIKSLIGILAVILSIAGVYFTLTGSLATTKLDVVRMQDAVEMNSEFRIKWPRGELGSLPADSEQFMLIQHLSGQLEKLQVQVEEMMHNKVNIERLKMDMEQAKASIENLKDKVRQNGGERYAD